LSGILVRFIKKSDALMSIANENDSFTIEWVTPMRTNRYLTSRDGIGAYQAIQQSLVCMHEQKRHFHV
jgi:hypothetical protein